MEKREELLIQTEHITVSFTRQGEHLATTFANPFRVSLSFVSFDRSEGPRAAGMECSRVELNVLKATQYRPGLWTNFFFSH